MPVFLCTQFSRSLKTPYASLQNNKLKANLSISLLTNMQYMLLRYPLFFGEGVLLAKPYHSNYAVKKEI